MSAIVYFYDKTVALAQVRNLAVIKKEQEKRKGNDNGLHA
jgi:hypothetical protein